MDESVALDGGSRRRVRKAHGGDIGAEQIDEFFAALAETCNVALSARRAGFSSTWAYRRRRHDAAFRNQWVAAVREGYAKLELVLLERAMKGTPKPIRVGGGDRIIREYSNTLAVALLRRHAETADQYDGQPDESEAAELRARIIEQLDRLREREAGKAAKAVEIKDAAGRVELIRRALSGASLEAAPSGGRYQRTIRPASSVPTTLSLTYYERERDFQSGQARASLPGPGHGSRSMALPCVVAAGEAKAMADQLLAREWATRERLRVALPPPFLGIEPGDQVALDGVAGRWLVDKVSIERAVVTVDCRPAWASAGSRVADPGRPVVQPDVVALPSTLVLLDLPAVEGDVVVPSLQVAVASPSNTYRRVPLQVEVGGIVTSARSASAEAVVGDVSGILPDGQMDVVEPAHAIEVTLANTEHWLVSADEATLATGANHAAIGDEVVQFASAEPLSPGRFRLSGLRRGLRGSAAAMTGHAAGEAFVLLSESSLTILTFVNAQVGQTARVTALGVGNLADPPSVERVITA